MPKYMQIAPNDVMRNFERKEFWVICDMKNQAEYWCDNFLIYLKDE